MLTVKVLLSLNLYLHVHMAYTIPSYAVFIVNIATNGGKREL